jgi:hypothetical protein
MNIGILINNRYRMEAETPNEDLQETLTGTRRA